MAPELVASPDTMQRLLRWMLGPVPASPTPPEIAAWQDDGGAILPAEDGYEHTIGPMYTHALGDDTPYDV